MKKVLTVLLSVALLVTVAVSAAACKKTEPDPNAPIDRTEEQEQPSLSLDQTSLTLVVGDTQKITATLANAGGGEEISFTSDNQSVATVSTDGVVTAVSTGTATVTAAAGTLSAAATVTVSLGGDLPRLTFAGGVESSYGWNVGEAYEFTPQITLGESKTFTDANVTFRSSDETVLTFDGNKAVPKKKGNVTVSATAVWRGMDAQTYETLALSFSAEVRDRATFTVNGDTPQDVELYTVASVSGYEGAFTVSVPYVPALEFNGEQKTPTCTVADPTVADVVDGKLVAKKRGTTTLTLSYDSGDDVYSLPPIHVTVLRPTVEIAETVENFCNSVGGYKDANADYAVKTLDTLLAGGGTITLVDAFQGEKALTVTDNEVRGLDLDLDGPTQTEITVGTETVCYRFKSVAAYGDILSTRADLEQFNRSLAANGYKPLVGYFELANDIIAGEINFSYFGNWTDIGMAEGALGTNYFQGTFDGKGHTISGLRDKGGKLGFFGAIADNSTIKNVAFVNCSTETNGRVVALYVGNNVTMENLYIQTQAITASYPRGVLAQRIGQNFTANNIVVDIASVTSAWNPTNDFSTGLLFAGDSYLWQGNRNSVTNTYVFGAHYPIAVGYMNQGIAYAGNENDTTWAYGNDTTTAVQHGFAGVKRYDAKADMIADKDNDFTSFRDSGCWHMERGMPVWGAEAADTYAVYFGDTLVDDAFAADKNAPTTVVARLWNAVNVTLVSSDTTKLSVDNETHTFTLLDNAGATLTVKVGETTVATVAVTLHREVERYAGTVPYFAADIGKWKDPNDNYNAKTLQSLLTNPPAFTGALQDGNPVTLAPDGSLSGLTLSPYEMNEIVITLQTEDKDYEFVVEAYHGVLATKDDLSRFSVKDRAKDKPLIGYFVLAKDIIDGEINFSWFGSNLADIGMSEDALSTNYFQGTFDGQGHTISGLRDKNGRTGFFGAIAKGSTIKNVAFTNCSTQTNGRVLALFIDDNVKLENIYIHTLAITDSQPRGVLAQTICNNVTMNNIVVNITSLSTSWNPTNNNTTGLLFAGHSYRWMNNKNNITNAYVFGAHYPIAVGYMDKGIAYAGNETDATWEYGNATTPATQHGFAGVKRYDTKDDMIADASNNNFASFTDSGYWHLEGGIPAWGAAV